MMETIVETIGVPRFIWALIWSIQRYIELHPFLAVINLSFVMLVFFPAIKNRLKLGINTEGNQKEVFIWNWNLARNSVPYFKTILLILAIAQLAYISIFFNPNNKIEANNTFVLLLPVFEIDNSGGLKVSEDSELVQAEITSLLTDAGEEKKVFVVGRDDYPFRAFTPTTIGGLLKKISANSTDSFFYLYALKHDGKYEKFNFLISPGDAVAQNNQKDSALFHRYSNTFSQLLNSRGDIPQSFVIESSTNIFHALLTQAHTTQFTNLHMYRAAEEGMTNALNIATRTCRNMRNSPFIKQTKDAISFCDDLVKDLTYYQKMTVENNLGRKASMIYSDLKKNPFAPFKTEKQYLNWLISQEEYNLYGRYIPITGWIRLNSNLEKYIGYQAYSHPNEVPLNEIAKSLDTIIPGNSGLKSYYLFIVASIRHDVEGMQKHQKVLAQFDYFREVSDKATPLIEANKALIEEISQ